ncbi:MAG: sulfatase-like hydrolase/transferase [Proteobacteria bacterium]|nr:sulfatase-like hydrolase/transferase [Pseudomonadota bacterium]
MMLALRPNEAGAFGLRIDTLLIALAGSTLLLSFPRRLWLGLAILSPWVLLAPLESFYVFYYGKPTDVHVLGILSETNSEEVFNYLGFKLFPLLGVVWAIAGILFFAIRKACTQTWEWPFRARFWVFCISILILAMPMVSVVLDPMNPPIRAVVEADVHEDLGQASVSPELAALAELYPLGVPLRFYSYWREKRTRQSYQAQIEQFRFGASLATPPKERRIHVLVIGETGRPDRWQLNGYPRETTPRLMRQSNLVSFSDFISPWAWTRMAVPVILTRKPATNRSAFFPERSLISAYREAGFKTYWLSTQSPLGVHDSSIALHAAEADVTRYYNPANYKLRGGVDGDLLAPLDAILGSDESLQLIVLHTLGSHFNYSHRYPADFDYFRPSLGDLPHADLHDRRQRIEIGNAYDNSVRYTDHFLAEVIARLEATGATATLFYVADHGENLFDGECDESGHGHQTEFDFRVPALFWYSERFARAFPQKVELAQRRRHAPLSTTSVFATLLELGDLQTNGDSLASSFIHPVWTPASRMTQAGLDFDRSGRDARCRSLVVVGKVH